MLFIFVSQRVYDEEVEEPVPKTETQEKRPEQVWTLLIFCNKP